MLRPPSPPPPQAILTSEGWQSFLENDDPSVSLVQDGHSFVMFVDSAGLVFVVVITGGYPAKLIFASDGSGMIDGAPVCAP